MSKWDKILGGSDTVPDVSKPSKNQMTFISISMLILFVSVAIFFVYKARQDLNTSVINEIGTVISSKSQNEKIIDEVETLAKPADEPAPTPLPTVKAKYSGKTYFEHESFDIDSAFMDENTFDHFQKTFDIRHQPTQDTKDYKNVGQKDALKEFLSKSGQTAQQFYDSSDSYVPEEILDFEESKSKVYEEKSFNDEESMIVKEAVQYAPHKCSSGEAVLIWRDVLNAIKEASLLNIGLPEVSSEQRKSLEFWSRDPSAGKIAMSILNRLA